MTIGEKIQHYRKQNKMSQEELAKRLLVSRQTVSQWENGLTSPSVDNLSRLRDIFGVSFDAILDQEWLCEEASAGECYRIRYTDTDIHELYQLHMRPFGCFAILFLACCILMLFNKDASQSGFICAIVVCLRWLHNRRQLRENLKRLGMSEYEYYFQPNYILSRMYRQEETISEAKYEYSEIEEIRQYGDWLCIKIASRVGFIRKSQLQPNAILFSYMYQNPGKVKEKRVLDRWWFGSMALFIGSLLSVFAAISLVGTVSMRKGGFIEHMWLFFLLTPIPVASTIFGLILKKKGRKYKKNLIAGIIMTLVLCIYGSFSFVF